MIPVEFDEQNVIHAKDQLPYLPLPAYSNEKETISCYELTLRERVKIFFTGIVWLRQMNYGHPLQPQAPTVDNPFKEKS